MRGRLALRLSSTSAGNRTYRVELIDAAGGDPPSSPATILHAPGTEAPTPKTTQIALLRGVNLARKRRLGMAALRELLEKLGYEDARTYLQSGNVVLTTSKTPKQVKSELERQIAAKLGLETEVFVRTRSELARVIEADPLGDVVDNPSRYQVSFLSAKPSAKVVRELGNVDVAPEQFVVRGREIYAWHPGGIQRSKLAKLLSERQLGVSATARNWNTVTKLLALVDE